MSELINDLVLCFPNIDKKFVYFLEILHDFYWIKKIDELKYIKINNNQNITYSFKLEFEIFISNFKKGSIGYSDEKLSQIIDVCHDSIIVYFSSLFLKYLQNKTNPIYSKIFKSCDWYGNMINISRFIEKCIQIYYPTFKQDGNWQYYEYYNRELGFQSEDGLDTIYCVIYNVTLDGVKQNISSTDELVEFLYNLKPNMSFTKGI